MNHQLVTALEDILDSVAMEAATESLRQFRIMEEQHKQEAQGDRFLLRSHEAAEQLAISSASLDRLTRSGDLPFVRLGRSVRYSTENRSENGFGGKRCQPRRIRRKMLTGWRDQQ